MSSRKDGKLKQFLIAKRKETAPGVTNAPVWVMRKAEKRVWNPKGKRHWRRTSFGQDYRKLEGQGRI